jgi:hypothetical protein
LTHIELKKEAGYHATQYNAPAGGFSNRGNFDSPCPATIELYRCHLSYYIWHSWIDALIGTQLFYGWTIIISAAKVSQSTNSPQTNKKELPL